MRRVVQGLRPAARMYHMLDTTDAPKHVLAGMSWNDMLEAVPRSRVALEAVCRYGVDADS